MYYKVVSEVNGKLLPLVHSDIGVQYKIGEWTKPLPNSHLFCFDNIEEARRWAIEWDGLLFKCEIIKSKSNPIFLYEGNLDTINVINFLNKINKLKRNKKAFTHLLNECDFVTCDAIKLVNEIL